MLDYLKRKQLIGAGFFPVYPEYWEKMQHPVCLNPNAKVKYDWAIVSQSDPCLIVPYSEPYLDSHSFDEIMESVVRNMECMSKQRSVVINETTNTFTQSIDIVEDETNNDDGTSSRLRYVVIDGEKFYADIP